MRKEMFESEIARVWREHREAVDAIFMRSHGMTAAVHERLGQLNGAVGRAIGGNVTYYWGPAQYNLSTETLVVAYRITSDEIGKSFEATIEYGPDGVLLDGRGFAYQEIDHLLGLVTDKVWEAFQPPVVRRMEIYAPHSS